MDDGRNIPIFWAFNSSDSILIRIGDLTYESNNSCKRKKIKQKKNS